jgi:hypothetical protein
MKTGGFIVWAILVVGAPPLCAAGAFLLCLAGDSW